MRRFPPVRFSRLNRFPPPARFAITGTLLLGLSACGTTTAPGPAAPASVAAAAPSAATFGGTDLAWVEITIAMDEQLLPLLDLVPGKAADQRLVQLSTQVRDLHERELGDLRALHDEARLPAENPHKGMPMPGMVTPEQVAEAAAARGAAFDDLVVRRLTAHLEQGVTLAESERKAGVEPRTRALAEQVLDSRRTYLSLLTSFS
ncbi:uncharacterized protein (DUF305 family) [Pseudosporangium ferrugineum]|uniref:Uncharacterized protein (DUF305 family) n=1 Tax=Pseudosporangium ferrugineum TaxID=439699 RepID=A0A2T0RQN2_9ACTN|nr:uncharacterized protein (DUF305 family) [Pseudosporangium ferrugineum]